MCVTCSNHDSTLFDSWFDPVRLMIRPCSTHDSILFDSWFDPVRLMARPCSTHDATLFFAFVVSRVEIFHLIWSKMRAVWAIFLDDCALNLAAKCAVFERFIKKKRLKQLKIWAIWAFFFRRLRSKSCFEMSGLSGFWTVYLKKPLKSCAVTERFFWINRSKPFKSCAVFELFFFK